MRRGGGWFRGLTTLTCLMNLVPRLDAGRARRRALPRPGRRRLRLGDGAAAVPARSASRRRGPGRLGALVPRFHRGARRRGRGACARLGGPLGRLAGAARRHALRSRDRSPLPGRRAHARLRNKALEALDTGAGSGPRRCSLRCRRSSRLPSGWRRRTPGATRSTSSSCSRAPSRSCPRRSGGEGAWSGRAELIQVVLDEEPKEILDALLAALREGADRGRARLGGLVRGGDAHRPLPDQQRVRRLGHRAAHVHLCQRGRAGPAALAVARAPARGARRGDERAPRPLPQRAGDAPAEAARGESLSEAAVPARRPAARGRGRTARRVLPRRGRQPRRLIAALGACLLREDRNFHTIQCIEAAVRQHELLSGTDEAGLPLIAAARYLAAHAPTAARATADVRDRAAAAPGREGLRGRFASARRVIADDCGMRELPGGTVTFLFTDIEGSTSLLHELGAGEYAEALARAPARAAGGVRGARRRRGRHAGRRLLRRVRRRAARRSRRRARPRRARAGTDPRPDGPAHRASRSLTEEGYVGIDVHRAARIAAVGHGGQVLVSERTKLAVEARRPARPRASTG